MTEDAKLIERLRKIALMSARRRDDDDVDAALLEAADCLAVLGAENERLRDEVRVRRIADHDVLEDEVMRLRETLRWYYLTTTWPEKHTEEQSHKAAMDAWNLLQSSFARLTSPATGTPPAPRLCR